MGAVQWHVTRQRFQLASNRNCILALSHILTLALDITSICEENANCPPWQCSLLTKFFDHLFTFKQYTWLKYMDIQVNAAQWSFSENSRLLLTVWNNKIIIYDENVISPSTDWEPGYQQLKVNMLVIMFQIRYPVNITNGVSF